ncbi:MAG: DUF4097 family beta strand repeat-containing protein [Acidobacteriota bacterium]
MKKKLLLTAIIIFFTLFTFVHGYKYEKTINRSFKINKDGVFSLKNINGDVKFKTYDGNEIKVIAEKRSNYKDYFEELEIIFEKSENMLKIYTKRNRKNCRVSINYQVKIPENLSSTKISVVNGKLSGYGNLKDIILKTVNGKINYEGNFNKGEVSSVNGSVHIFTKDKVRDNISVRTVNGSISIELNEDSDIKVKAGTINGSIRSDFNIKTTKGFIGSKAEGSVNKGEHYIKLKTVNGSIKILQN